MKFSEKIQRAREENHLTQQALADAAGISKRAVAAYETGGAVARRATMRRLAQVLHVSYDYLMDEAVTDPRQGMEKMEYIDRAEAQLGSEGAREIDELLEANRRLFAGGELSEEAKDTFYQAVTKAYLLCKMEAKKKYGRSPGSKGEGKAEK